MTTLVFFRWLGTLGGHLLPAIMMLLLSSCGRPQEMESARAALYSIELSPARGNSSCPFSLNGAALACRRVADLPQLAEASLEYRPYDLPVAGIDGIYCNTEVCLVPEQKGDPGIGLYTQMGASVPILAGEKPIVAVTSERFQPLIIIPGPTTYLYANRAELRERNSELKEFVSSLVEGK